jgi:hypothetical protein
MQRAVFQVMNLNAFKVLWRTTMFPSHLTLSRRAALGGLFAASAAPFLGLRAETLPSVLVHRAPSCSCCESWVAHMRKAGFSVTLVDEADIDAVKARLKVPQALASCHTAEVGGYAVEGHAPAEAVRRLLNEKPDAIGVAVPGMPMGAPGMESSGPADAYEVVLFGAWGTRSYGSYRGATAG